jgi:UDP-glucose 4-epimerase
LKVLITEGYGFLGSTLALHLCERGHDVVAMDNLVRRGSESNIDSEINQIGGLRSGVFSAGGAMNSFFLLEAAQFLEKKLGRSMSITHEESPRKADTVT